MWVGVGVSVGRLVGEDGCGCVLYARWRGKLFQLETCDTLLLDPVSRECKVSWEIRPWYSVLLWQAFPATPSMR